MTTVAPVLALRGCIQTRRNSLLDICHGLPHRGTVSTGGDSLAICRWSLPGRWPDRWNKLLSCSFDYQTVQDMWTIGCADRLRFPHVPPDHCGGGKPGAWEHGEMLTFDHIPTGSTTTRRIRFDYWKGNGNLPKRSTRYAADRRTGTRRDSLLTPPPRCPDSGVHLRPRLSVSRVRHVDAGGFPF